MSHCAGKPGLSAEKSKGRTPSGYAPGIVVGCVLSIATLNAVAAPSSVALYGSIDSGISYANSVGGHAQWAAEEGNTQPNKWGLRGSEDLGGGSNAFFLLENGFSVLNGAFTKTGSMFNRFAYVGVGNPRYGSLSLGHQAPFSYSAVGRFASANQGFDYRMFHPGNIDELTNSGTTQTDNTVRYVSPTWAGWSAGAMLGMGNTSNFSYQRLLSMGVMYDNGPLHGGFAYGNEHNRAYSIGATALTLGSFQGLNMATATYTSDKTTNIDVGGLYSTGNWSVHATYSHVRLQRLTFVSTFQTVDVGGGYQTSAANLVTLGAFSSRLDNRRWSQVGLSDIYSFSKRSQVYVSAMYQVASNTAAAIYSVGPASGREQVAILAGIHQSF